MDKTHCIRGNAGTWTGCQVEARFRLAKR
jgi:hypothetical protein